MNFQMSFLALRNVRENLFRAALPAMLAAGWLAPALAAETPVSIRADVPDSGQFQATVDTPLRLAAQLSSDAGPLAGAEVRWTIKPSADALLSHDHSLSSAGGNDLPPAGEASTLFTAHRAGSFVVTATTQANPGCSGPDCARWATAEFRIEVGAALAATRESHGGLGAAIAGAGAAAAILIASHGNDEGVGVSKFVKVSGDGQSADQGAALPNPLVVKAFDDGTPAEGVTIVWSVSGGGTISATTTTADSSGESQITVTNVGPGPGPVVVTAQRSDFGQTVSFNISVNTRTLEIVSGNGQSAPVNSQVPAPLVVEADLNGTPQAGIGITWTVLSGDATIASISNGGNTDTSGQSSAVIDLGPTPGIVQVQASRNDRPGLVQVFTINSLLVRSLGPVSGDGQTAAPNVALPAPLVVHATNNGADAAGVTINWTATGGATLSSATSVTDAAGQASVNVTNTGPGPNPFTVTAVRADDATAVVSFNENILPPQVTPASGDGQSGNPGTAATNPLVVNIVDGGGNPAVGQTVTWTVTSGSATVNAPTSVTDGAGNAQMGFTYGLTPGPVTITASAFGGAQTVAFTALVNGTIVTTTLNIVSGDAQVLDVGQTSAPMVVELLDAGTPLPGQTITWSTSNGTVTPTTSVTDALGRASATVTPSASGPISVGASFAAVAQYTASSTAFTHNTTLGSLPTLSTDEAAVAIALDNACSALTGGTGLTTEEQDLLDQCAALAAASSTPAQAADAIQELIPDVAKTQTQVGEAAVDAQFDNLEGRINTLRTGMPSAASFGGLTLTTPTGTISLGALATSLLDGDAPAQDAGFDRWGFFASGNIGRGDTEAVGDAPRYDFDIRGLTVGIDYRQSDNLVFGVALGYTNQDTTLAGGQGSLGMHGYSLSAYGSMYRAKSWYFDGALSLANNDYSHKRRIEYTLPGETVDQVARASSSGLDTSASLTIGRDFNRQEWNWGFYGQAMYTRQHFDGFDEKLDVALPGSGLALSVDDRSVTALSSVLGAKASITHSVSWGVVVPQVGLEWQREYSGDPDAFRAFLITDPTGTPILITGDALDGNYFRFNIGMSFVLTHGRSGFVRYDRVFGREGNSQENLQLGIRIEF